MSIQDCVHDALNTLRDIVTDETVDVELRISAAEKILDYAASLGEYQDNKTDAIGFTIGEREQCDGQDFGDFLKALRGKRSLREMENLTGVSHTYLSSLEKGFDPRTGKGRKPTPETLKKLARAFGVPHEDIMKRAGCL